MDREPRERLVEDDQAAQRAADFRDRALLNQRLRALRQPLSEPGVCTNCANTCLPLAVYCDESCREDHELRLRAIVRAGKA